MAEVIRAADTNRNADHRAATGLLSLPAALYRQYREDHAELEADMVRFDVLYRWTRAGYEEPHDWPSSRSA